MIRILPVVASLLLAACSQQEQAAPPSNKTAEVAPEPAAKAPVPSLQGAWRITAITGAPTTGSTITVTLGEGRANLSADCLRRTGTYSQDRNTVDFAPFTPGGGDCGRMPSGQEEMTFSAFQDANLAIFDQDGSEVSLSGTSGTLTLERR